jgi:hypothetical protein
VYFAAKPWLRQKFTVRQLSRHPLGSTMQSITEMITRFMWQRKLTCIPSKEWSNFSMVTPDGRRSPFEKLWWNLSFDSQRFRKSYRGRFALGHLIKVCYLASDQSITVAETSAILRQDDHLTLNKIIEFVFPKPMKLSPSFRLNLGISLLDLTSPDAPFLRALEYHKIISDRIHFYNEVITGRKPSCYPITQAIAHMAFRHQFAGIIWKSARQPTDWKVASSDCLVLFHDYLIDAINLI